MYILAFICSLVTYFVIIFIKIIFFIYTDSFYCFFMAFFTKKIVFEASLSKNMIDLHSGVDSVFATSFYF